MLFSELILATERRDNSLNARAVPPTGADYNALFADVMATKATAAKVEALLREAILEPEGFGARFDNDQDVNGGDLVEWFGGWRLEVISALFGGEDPDYLESFRRAIEWCHVNDRTFEATVFLRAASERDYYLSTMTDPAFATLMESLFPAPKA